MAAWKDLSRKMPAQAAFPSVTSAVGAGSVHQPGAATLFCIFSWQGEFLEEFDHCWSHFRKLTAFANAELMQLCESWVTLCTGLIFAQHVKSIGEKNAKACVRKSCCIIFLAQMFSFPFYLLIFLGVQWFSYSRLIALSKQSLAQLGCAKGYSQGILGPSLPEHSDVLDQ